MIQKIALSVAICLIAISAVKAQDEDRRENFEFGARAGINFSNVWDAQTDEFRADTKAGFAGGVFLGIPIGKFLGIQPEVLISQKGIKTSGTLFEQTYSNKRTTTFLDIPLQVQVKPAKFLTIVAGPQFSYLLKQKDEFTFGINSSVQEQEFQNENIRKNILGFVFGADIVIEHIMVSGRIGWDMQNNLGDGTSTTPRYKNQWLQFTLGYII